MYAEFPTNLLGNIKYKRVTKNDLHFEEISQYERMISKTSKQTRTQKSNSLEMQK